MGQRNRYDSELLSRMARGSDQRTGHEEVTGQTPISVIRKRSAGFRVLRFSVVAELTYQAKLHRG
jgi:hypothetical protein